MAMNVIRTGIAALAAGWMVVPMMVVAQDAAAIDDATASAAAAVEDVAEEDIVSATVSTRPRDTEDPFKLSRDELREFAQIKSDGYVSYKVPSFEVWRAALKRELGSGSLDKATEALATQFGIDRSAMRKLAQLSLIAELHRFDLDEPDEKRLRAQLIEAMELAGHVRLAEEIAAYAIDQFSDCDQGAFDSIVGNATDPAESGWDVALLAPCADTFSHFAERFPERAAPALLAQANWGALDATRKLPLYSWLASDAGLSRVALEDRSSVHAWLVRRLSNELFDTGLDTRAIATIDGLPDPMRDAVLAPEMPAFVAHLDGLELPFHGDTNSPAVDLAIAYANAGQRDKAAGLLAKRFDLALAKQAFTCAFERETSDGTASEMCDKFDRHRDLELDALILDRVLNDPGADPYPIAEAGFTSGLGNAATGPAAELRCRYFADARFSDICSSARRSVLGQAMPESGAYNKPERERFEEVLGGLDLAGFADLSHLFSGELDAVRTRYAVYADNVGHEPRPSIEPIASEFAQLPLPAEYRSPTVTGSELSGPDWPKGWARLPRGFAPVRWGAEGERAVAISLSGAIDPSGEVSGGGYWAHLSSDRGRTWQTPRYIGLAEFFPYVVLPRSKLPLLAGDRLQVEVEIALLDTASIMYPPVALRTRRKERNLYLDIPLAALERDTDEDGLTDIVEHHLLLDRPGTDGTKPFVVGSDAAAGACADRDPGLGALRMSLLDRIAGTGSTAIIEPVDRPNDSPLAMGWRRIEQGQDWPLFLKGSASDFACVAANGRLMIVYDEHDEAELQRRTPDFRLLEFPPLVMNRAGDRGYVVWSAGWTGGTLRVRRIDGRWVVDALSEWVT